MGYAICIAYFVLELVRVFSGDFTRVNLKANNAESAASSIIIHSERWSNGE